MSIRILEVSEFMVTEFSTPKVRKEFEKLIKHVHKILSERGKLDLLDRHSIKFVFTNRSSEIDVMLIEKGTSYIHDEKLNRPKKLKVTSYNFPEPIVRLPIPEWVFCFDCDEVVSIFMFESEAKRAIQNLNESIKEIMNE